MEMMVCGLVVCGFCMGKMVSAREKWLLCRNYDFLHENYRIVHGKNHFCTGIMMSCTGIVESCMGKMVSVQELWLPAWKLSHRSWDKPFLYGNYDVLHGNRRILHGKNGFGTGIMTSCTEKTVLGIYTVFCGRYWIFKMCFVICVSQTYPYNLKTHTSWKPPTLFQHQLHPNPGINMYHFRIS
jgi:hypothetical protein